MQKQVIININCLANVRNETVNMLKNATLANILEREKALENQLIEGK